MDTTDDSPGTERMHAAPRSRRVRTRHDGMIDIGDGDFAVVEPDNQRTSIRLRTGWALFPLTSAAGVAPTDYILRRLETCAPGTAVRAYEHLRAFDRFLSDVEGFGATTGRTFSWAEVDEGVLLRYYATLIDKGTGYKFTHIRHFYCWATGGGYPGFSTLIARRLSELHIGANPRGVAVLTGDRTKGSLTESEFGRIVGLLSTDTGPLLPRLCTALLVELGGNPAQFIQLRVRDVHAYESSSAGVYDISLPRSKKRDGYRQRKTRPISASLGQLLVEYVAATTEDRARLGINDPPLLLSDTGDPLTGRGLVGAINRFASGTGIRIAPRRLRRTFATRLVAQGAPIDVVAELMDHTDTQCVGTYFEMRGDAVERLDGATGSRYRALMVRFQGVIVDPKAQAGVPNARAQRVKAIVLGGNVSIGDCGRDIQANGLCPLAPPFACYTCPKFRAWRDADHRGVAASVQVTRDALADQNPDGDGSPLIAQYDGLIGAIHEVASACDEPIPQKPKRRRGPGKGGHS
jgi:integrase